MDYLGGGFEGGQAEATVFGGGGVGQRPSHPSPIILSACKQTEGHCAALKDSILLHTVQTNKHGGADTSRSI